MPKKKVPTRGPVGAPTLQANVAELRALAHPLRLRILELFAETARTTKQVADLLGQPATRLYHHVAALERAGLLELKETRKNRGTVEKWYETGTRTLGITAAEKSGTKRRGADRSTRRAVATTVLDQSRREVLSVVANPSSEPPLIARLVVAAPPGKMGQIRRRLYSFLEEVQKEYSCDDDIAEDATFERWAMTMTFAPVWPRKGSPDA